MGKIVLAALSFVFTGFFAAAQAQDEVLSEPITAFTPGGMAETLRALDMSVEAAQLQNGSPILKVTTNNGRRFIAVFYACSPQQRQSCLGVDLTASWVRDGGFAKGAIQDFGAAFPFAKSYARGDAAILSRYLTADYGFAQGNLVVNVQVFVNFMDRFAAYAQQAPESETGGGLQVSLSAAETAAGLLQTNASNDHSTYASGAFTDHMNTLSLAGKIAN